MNQNTRWCGENSHRFRYVPDIKKNFISLGTLKFFGCKCTGIGGIIKISLGVLVIVKARKSSMLYTLLKSTVTGVAAISTSYQSSFDIIKFWHMLLGHKREIFLSSAKEVLCGQSTNNMKLYEHCVLVK